MSTMDTKKLDEDWIAPRDPCLSENPYSRRKAVIGLDARIGKHFQPKIRVCPIPTRRCNPKQAARDDDKHELQRLV
jgi:hypothetical protein